MLVSINPMARRPTFACFVQDEDLDLLRKNDFVIAADALWERQCYYWLHHYHDRMYVLEIDTTPMFDREKQWFLPVFYPADTARLQCRQDINLIGGPPMVAYSVRPTLVARNISRKGNFIFELPGIFYGEEDDLILKLPSCA